MGEGNQNTSLIIIPIVIGLVVFLMAAFVLLYFLVIRKNKIKKEVRNLDRRFQYNHALLIGQDAQYVKRLEIISRTNLLYVEIHTRFLKRFKEIRDKHDSHAQSTVNTVMDMLDDRRYKQIKAYFQEATEIIDNYVNLVEELNKDLLQVVKPEEDCRQSSLNLKEQLRRIKQDYYAKQGDLTIMVTSFEKVFEYIDQLFEQFENFVESAQYDDANSVLPKIDNILHELTAAMIDLPNLCIMVTDVIPNKLSSLENTYEIMESQNYPLRHLCVNQFISEMRKNIDIYTSRIKQFDLRGIHDKLDEIINRIDEFFKFFEDEKTARVDFEEQNEGIYRDVNTIERRFIKLCNTIPEVSRIYVINDSHKSKINEIQNEINKVGALKRSLDTFIHSTSKQPYSLLVNKMDELKNASQSIMSELDEFNSYITSLKTDSEQAYHLVFAFFTKVKQAEKEVRDISIPRLQEKYSPQFDKVYGLLNEINSLLLKSPIDVDEVNKNVAELYDVSNNILDGGTIAQDHNMMMLAENAIMYANRDRNHLGDIDQLIIQAETFFKEGDFEQAYIIAGNALKKINATNNERQ